MHLIDKDELAEMIRAYAHGDYARCPSGLLGEIHRRIVELEKSYDRP